MHTVKCKAHFDSAHFLKDYPGKCKNIHGHRWVFEAEVAGELTDGMVQDFTDLKRILNSLSDEFDHKLIYEKGTISQNLKEALSAEDFALCETDFRPTAENFAEFLYKTLKKSIKVTKITVWETPETAAVYSE
ncbi:MAG: 6-carboxytetrahydropterin synthase QueD [Ruminococcus sp.]|jgi:6-pyruvoyltetrahydropterin/6-carboxytetrahydropterin synthase|nr:6-carboxytetrahydropterin synthase QueD [Ruminococcus sp.]